MIMSRIDPQYAADICEMEKNIISGVQKKMNAITSQIIGILDVHNFYQDAYMFPELLLHESIENWIDEVIFDLEHNNF